MASFAVSPILRTILTSIDKLLQEDASSIGGVKDRLDDLKLTLATVQEAAVHAEEKQIGDEGLRDWLEELESAAYNAQDVFDSLTTDIFVFKRENREGIACQSLYADKIDAVTDEMKGFIDKIGQNSNDISADRCTDIDVSQSSNAERTQQHFRVVIQGRDGVKEKLISNLLQSDDDSGENNVSVCPIVGLPGIGKTTLAQLIYNDARIKERFVLGRMWITVSSDFNLKKILQEIIEVYSDMKEATGFSLDTIKSRFQEFLPGKRFLLVLDDVWTHDRVNDWDPLLNLLELGKKGSKLVVTSRIHKVAEILVPNKNNQFELGVLSDDECWSLFKSIALANARLPWLKQQQLEDIGKQIVARCQGLPLAVTSMAGLLRKNKELYQWEYILRSNLWEKRSNLRDKNSSQILPVLQLSYDNLSSHLKQCFAFCSMYPKAYAFDKIELVKLWMAESFVDSSSDDTEEDTGAAYFDELQERYFFQRIEIDERETYKMHDLIHDLASSVSRHHSCRINNENSVDSFRACRRVSFHCQDVEDLCEKVTDTWKNLRTVLLPAVHLKEKSLENLFDKLRFLRVLDLSASTLLELPSSIEQCKLLRYLDLSRTEIKKLPNSLCRLYNLQTLKLVRCVWLFELPEDFGNLVNLRHLELDEMFWFKCVALPSKLGALSKLQNLETFMVYQEEGHGIKELKQMQNLNGTLHISKLENAINAEEAQLDKKEKLRKIVFEWSGRDGGATDQAADARLLNNIQPHSSLEEIQISHYSGIDFPRWMSGTLRNLVKISLRHCRNCRILFLGQQPQLQELSIKGLLELETCDQAELPKLYRLTISNCPKLSLIPSFIPNLRVMKIKRCNSLQELPMAPSLQFLILVENLSLQHWGEYLIQLQYVGGEIEIQHTLINLLELKLSSCPNLATLPRIFAPQKLEISRCEKLSDLPKQEFCQRLQHLALDSFDHGSLVHGIPDTGSLYSLVISNISNMNFLPNCPPLPGLKSLYVHNCNELVILSERAGSLQGLTSLELLSVRGCPNLVRLPYEGLPTSLQCLSVVSCDALQLLGSQESLSRLTSLKDLYIEDCPMLRCFPESGLPGSLKHLLIRNCGVLSEACLRKCGPEWEKIMHIPDLEIDHSNESSTRPSAGVDWEMSSLFYKLLCCINPQ